MHWLDTLPRGIAQGLYRALHTPDGLVLEASLAASGFVTDSWPEELTTEGGHRRQLLEPIQRLLACLAGNEQAPRETLHWLQARSIGFIGVVDDDLQHLARWPRIARLWTQQASLGAPAIAYLASLPNLTELRPSEHVKESFYEALPRLTTLETLSLTQHTRFTAAFLPSLLGLPSLRSLDLTHVILPHRFWSQIATHPTLEILRASELQGDSFSALLEARSLIELRILKSHLDDAALLDAPTGASKLFRLGLPGAEISDEGAQGLTLFPRLTHLDFSATKITDRAITSIAALDLLELDIGRTRVSDASIPLLEQMPSLRVLRVTSSRMTDAGLSRLKAARPGCAIVTS
jgi:Leucine-rich repeat (LRR) protein